MAGERAAFLTQMVEVLTSTVSFGERLNNMVHLLARNLKMDLALYFGLDKARETLLLNVSSQGPVRPTCAWSFPWGKVWWERRPGPASLPSSTASSRE